MKIVGEIRSLFNWDNRSLVGLLLAVVGFFGLILIAPEAWIARLGFDSFRAEYPWVPGVGLLLSAAVLTGRLILARTDCVKGSIRRRKRWGLQRRKLNDLSPAERSLLGRCIAQDTIHSTSFRKMELEQNWRCLVLDVEPRTWVIW